MFFKNWIFKKILRKLDYLNIMSSGSPNESTASRLERIGRRSDANDRQEIDSDFVEESIGKFYIFSWCNFSIFCSVRKSQFCLFVIVCSSNRNSKKSWKSDANESQEIDSDLVEENIGKFYFHVIFSDVI